MGESLNHTDQGILQQYHGLLGIDGAFKYPETSRGTLSRGKIRLELQESLPGYHRSVYIPLPSEAPNTVHYAFVSTKEFSVNTDFDANSEIRVTGYANDVGYVEGEYPRDYIIAIYAANGALQSIQVKAYPQGHIERSPFLSGLSSEELTREAIFYTTQRRDIFQNSLAERMKKEIKKTNRQVSENQVRQAREFMDVYFSQAGIDTKEILTFLRETEVDKVFALSIKSRRSPEGQGFAERLWNQGEEALEQFVAKHVLPGIYWRFRGDQQSSLIFRWDWLTRKLSHREVTKHKRRGKQEKTTVDIVLQDNTWVQEALDRRVSVQETGGLVQVSIQNKRLAQRGMPETIFTLPTWISPAHREDIRKALFGLRSTKEEIAATLPVVVQR